MAFIRAWRRAKPSRATILTTWRHGHSTKRRCDSATTTPSRRQSANGPRRNPSFWHSTIRPRPLAWSSGRGKRSSSRWPKARGVAAVVDREKGDKSSNYAVLFDENGFNGQSRYCWGSAWLNKAFDITRAELRINPSRIRDIDRSEVHEPMHTLGFNSPPHAALSVLSNTYKGKRTLTPLDLRLIHTLYDDRLPAGNETGRSIAESVPAFWASVLGSSAADIVAVCTDRKAQCARTKPAPAESRRARR